MEDPSSRTENMSNTPHPTYGAAIKDSVRSALLSALGIGEVVIGVAVFLPTSAGASHQGHERHAETEGHGARRSGDVIPGTSIQIVQDQEAAPDGRAPEQAVEDPVRRTVMDAFIFMLEHRADYPRFDESLKKDALQHIVIQPTVVNQEGKAFPFLVVRTKEPGRVNLLISASALKQKEYVGHPDKLVPELAREFQWVVSKSDTAPKATIMASPRDLKQAAIRSDQEIQAMSGADRVQAIQRLFETYLRTVDDLKSLEGRRFYEVGTLAFHQPDHSDSTTKLYDLRIRQALQRIMNDTWFLEQTPKAVRSLLNGTIWNVAFVHIDRRDWATRTRVNPEEKAVVVGERRQVIQPASILVNVQRRASPDDPFYADTQGLPMGALSTDQLARVIAIEIQRNIVEKSMSGHVAQDEMTAPK